MEDPTSNPPTPGPPVHASNLPSIMEPATPAEGAPSPASVQRYLLYTLSLPERALRGGSAAVGSALRDSAALLVPQAFQNSKTYSVMVRQMLDFMAEDVGGVARPADPALASPARVENFVARKTVGNFIELAGMATMHLSPLTVLAIVSDVAHGSQVYLKELTAELKKEGVIDQSSTIDHVDDLLAAVAQASSVTAGAFDTPPISVDGLKETIEQTRQAVGGINAMSVMPQEEVARIWNEMHELATREHVSLWQLSSAMTMFSLSKVNTVGQGALSSVRVAGNLLDRHILTHYADALTDIRQRGFYRSLASASGEYVEAVWNNFSTDKTTVTEDLLSGKYLGQAWDSARRWLGMGG